MEFTVSRGNVDDEDLYYSYTSPNVINGEIKDDIMGGCVARRILVENLEEMDRYVDLDVDGRIILLPKIGLG
jgi:hypothetical protein